MTMVAASPTPAVSTACVEIRAYGRADTSPRADDEVRGQPPVEPAEQGRDIGHERMEHRGEESDAQQRRHHRSRHRIRDHRVGGHRAELEEEDRRGCDSARDRDGDHCRRCPRHRIPLEPEHEARNEREDRCDRGERELEAGVEQVVRAPGEQHQRSEQQKPPAIALPPADPGERCERPSDTGADDRWLRADREDVGPDGCERSHLARHARDAEQPRHEQDSARDERDVLTRDGKQVIEAGRPKRVAQRLVKPFVLPEHDPEQHRAPLAGDARCKRRADGGPQSVGHPAEAASATDDLGIPSLQDHVHAVTAEPGSLVEAVFGAPRLGDEHGEAKHGSLGRRTAQGQLQQNRFADAATREGFDARGKADGVLRAACRACHDYACHRCPPDLGRQRAAVDRVEP